MASLSLSFIKSSYIIIKSIKNDLISQWLSREHWHQ